MTMLYSPLFNWRWLF